MPQHKVECDCGFKEQSTDTITYDDAYRVLENHQENCTEFTTIWEAVHTSSLSE